MPQAIDLTEQFIQDYRLCEGELEDLRAAHEVLKEQLTKQKVLVDGDASRKLLAAEGEVNSLQRELQRVQEQLQLAEVELRKQSVPRPCTECERLRRDLAAQQNSRPQASPDAEIIRQSQARLQMQIETLEKERKSRDIEHAELKRKLKQSEDKCLDLERAIYVASQGR